MRVVLSVKVPADTVPLTIEGVRSLIVGSSGKGVPMDALFLTMSDGSSTGPLLLDGFTRIDVGED